MKRLFIIVLILLGIGSVSIAQNTELDSLMNVEKNYQYDDSIHLKLLTDILGQLNEINNDKYFPYCNKALSIARKISEAGKEIDVLIYIMRYYARNKMYDSAIVWVNKSVQYCQEIGDSINLGRFLFNLARLHYDKSDWEAAEDQYFNAMKVYHALGIAEKEFQINYNLSLIYQRKGERIKAQECLLKALDYANENEKANYSALIYKSLGDIFFDQWSSQPSNLEKSIEYYSKAAELAASIGDEILAAKTKGSLATVYQLLKNKYELMIKTHIEIIPVFNKYKDYENAGTTYTNLGIAIDKLADSAYQRLRPIIPFESIGLRDTNQHRLAIEAYQKAKSYTDLASNGQYYSLVYYNLGVSYLNLREYDQAISHMQKALKIADSLQWLDSKEACYKGLSSAYEKMGSYDSAYLYYKEYIKARDTLDNQSIRDQLARKEAEYEFSIKEKDLLHQKELSDVAAASANTELQRQLLLTRTREQEIQLKDRALQIGQKEKEMQHLAYLKKMAELDVVKLEKQDKDKQLSLTKQSFALQNLKLSQRELERNLLIAGVALSLFSIFLIFRNYRNQRKANLRQQELNTLVTETNEELNSKNTELASTLDNLRTTQAQLVETEKLKENEVIRRRISQDIHDDISSGLTRIAWLSELAKEKAARGEQQEAGNALEKILASSRETVDRLGEIIWAINPDRDNLEGFFAYLRTYIVKFFEDTPFNVTLDFPEKKPDLKFNPDLKRTLFLVVKEALHNVAKHSKAGQVAVAFHCPDHRYSITITDDGKGFDIAATQLKGNGLKNMQKRMESVGGKIEIDSRLEKGTVVSLSGEVYS